METAIKENAPVKSPPVGVDGNLLVPLALARGSLGSLQEPRAAAHTCTQTALGLVLKGISM